MFGLLNETVLDSLVVLLIVIDLLIVLVLVREFVSGICVGICPLDFLRDTASRRGRFVYFEEEMVRFFDFERIHVEAFVHLLIVVNLHSGGLMKDNVSDDWKVVVVVEEVCREILKFFGQRQVP